MGNSFMIKSILYYCSCSSFLLKFICFTKYFLMPTALVPTAFAVHAVFRLTKAAKHIFKFPHLWRTSYKTLKPKRAATQQENIWAGLLLTSRNAELLKLITQATTVCFVVVFFLKHIREIPADFPHSELMASSHPHSACLIYVPVGSVFPVDRVSQGAETVFLVTYHFVQR